MEENDECFKEIKDGSITEEKIANRAVNRSKISFNPFNLVKFEHTNFNKSLVDYDDNASLTITENLTGQPVHNYQIQMNKNNDRVTFCEVEFLPLSETDSARVYVGNDTNDIIVANLLGMGTPNCRIDYFRMNEGNLIQNFLPSTAVDMSIEKYMAGFSITLGVAGDKLLTYLNGELKAINKLEEYLSGFVRKAGIALRGTLNANSHIRDGNTNNDPESYMFFSIDDTISILRDITNNENKYTSIFQNDKLKILKQLRDEFGIVVTCFLFIEDDNWDLNLCTEKFKNEFIQNANWLKFGFHSKKSGHNYNNLDGDSFVKDYTECLCQIRRFSSSANIDSISRVENFNISLESQIAAKKSNLLFNGLHGADDNRASNAGLSGAALSLLRTNDDYYDIENDLYYLRSETRLDGKASADVTTLLNNQYYDVNNNRIYNMFFHETTLQNLSTQGAVRAAAQWAFDKHIRFDFPQNNKPIL